MMTEDTSSKIQSPNTFSEDKPALDDENLDEDDEINMIIVQWWFNIYFGSKWIIAELVLLNLIMDLFKFHEFWMI